ncbi:leucine-rich repeat receptor protein kinase EMS1-like [Syzygium oleosum]|uniref:leucine-rich repeat receptor protein kinase EMS1-like n=1 Tax=Syzygium oleosum TaxID=219896 RepID=UPI0011D23A4E|nr:leucine-rich repeat receptor protein kinase EMS1-like [Syzygium oleosum]
MKQHLQAVVAAAAIFVSAYLFFVFLVFARCRRMRNRGSGESASFDPKLRISMDELRNATDNFHPLRIIGNGGFGLVYKGCLANGLAVAIKKLEPDAFEGFREFRADMETLGQLHHPNIVKILGYCMSNSDRVLVYEFIERGSLDQWLHDTTSLSENGNVSWLNHPVERSPLSWDTRMKIIKGVASGLAFMHGLPTPIIHRGIKASDVLLDTDFEAHIADFGLARKIRASQSHVSTQPAGAMGYMPPEYKDGYRRVTAKADVYSFGVLMFEIATGRSPSLPVVDRGEEFGLTAWARNMVGENRQMEMVDPAVSRDGLVGARVKEYLDIACMCTCVRAKDRPGMSRVLGLLKSPFG